MSSGSIDPQQAVAAVRRTLARAPGQVADGVGRVVRNTPDDRLGQLMRSPARRVVLDGIFWQMPQYMDQARARRVHATVRWCVTGRADGGTDTYYLRIDDGTCHVTRRPDYPDPRLTITVDGVDLLKLAIGRSDPIRAYFTGRVTVTGDVVMAARLAVLFRLPASRR
jgi:predicted lipid carrier protein YhbT